ncbi:MAG: hypothetical protein BJ554DRAFT_5333 [Olpidium bornovanus]|uniref:Uncharacterized protein n=1 Tax=Olpidium bornovanus TaxID=278681 RepID=A0A8H8DL41_9FUNG|nr:MAG: hypothetical protein BJ554DRAFT_5333 [Olpidium bornovanus]
MPVVASGEPAQHRAHAVPAHASSSKASAVAAGDRWSSTTVKVSESRSHQVPTGLFIDNAFVPAVSGKTFPTVNPATGKEIVQKRAGGRAKRTLRTSPTRDSGNALDESRTFAQNDGELT